MLPKGKKLNQEEKRGLAEQLTQEELVIVDLLTKPEIALTNRERTEVKKVARALLEKLKKEKSVLEWRRQQTTRAMVFTTIADILEELPRAYNQGTLRPKMRRCLPALYKSYMGQGKSVYPVEEICRNGTPYSDSRVFLSVRRTECASGTSAVS